MYELDRLDNFHRSVFTKLFNHYQTENGITQDDKNYYLSFDMPGVKKEDIKISITAEEIVVEAKNEKRAYRQSISIRDKVNVPDAIAKYENGVLEITVPKGAKDVRQITVQ